MKSREEAGRMRRVFDAAYYKRYYEDPRTRVVSAAEIERLADFVTSYMAHLRIPLRTVLDVGCGLGLWKAALRARGFTGQYVGTEVSTYLCRKYGWINQSIENLESKRRYDLVICQGVLPYIDDDKVPSAIGNLARACHGALYLEAYTHEDRKQGSFDIDISDDRMRLRSTRWYRRVLSRHFISCGGGVFVPKDSDVVLYELERC